MGSSAVGIYRRESERLFLAFAGKPDKLQLMFRKTQIPIFFVALAGAAFPLSGHSQTAISGLSVSVSDAGDSSNYSGALSFRNTTYAITNFSTAVQNYDLGGTATSVYIRRNTDSNGNGVSNQVDADNNNYTSTWNTQSSSTANLLGTYQSSLNNSLLNNNIIMGGDNVFVNSNSSGILNAANIERIDFHFSGGITVNSGEGITVFDRGLVGAHDSVNVAVFTAWSSSGGGRPSTYSGNVVTLDAAGYSGSNLDWDPATAGVQDSLTYTIMRFGNGDNTTSLVEAVETNTQGIAGSFVSFADLGIPAGTVIFGYSIMGSDVTTSVGSLADWKNATYYPTNTSDAGGGIDLVSFNGRIARPVPEPGTYGLFLTAGGLAVWAVAKRRRSVFPAA